MSQITVLGAGTWGIALARMLSKSGHEVTVWSALPDEIENLNKERRQPNLITGIVKQGDFVVSPMKKNTIFPKNREIPWIQGLHAH